MAGAGVSGEGAGRAAAPSTPATGSSATTRQAAFPSARDPIKDVVRRKDGDGRFAQAWTKRGGFASMQRVHAPKDPARDREGVRAV